jgi:hypothetical protein
MDVHDSRVHNYPPRWNAAPSQDPLVIRRNHHTGEISLDALRWGLIPSWCQDPKGGRKPINAKCETVHSLPTFRDAYRRRRAILPVDGFFEWKVIRGQKAKQPYAIAMKDGKPFGIGALWENWKGPASGEWIRTFVPCVRFVLFPRLFQLLRGAGILIHISKLTRRFRRANARSRQNPQRRSSLLRRAGFFRAAFWRRARGRCDLTGVPNKSVRTAPPRHSVSAQLLMTTLPSIR